ncbi:hypothetical protein [Blastococcus mobilis]|uniref:Putative peptide zinc metalloprotease protein n=1 Tax=Blastococcus mobilis TaxID=1938746 RepID=A0A238Z3Y1_9ACTN|nr:hypothetical protein [Blastococcus mobilis]SNR78086.1 putative peptide zinc metalloprotease protein [Blastococcus mobilis]
MGENAVLAPPAAAGEDPVSRERTDGDGTTRAAEAAVHRLAEGAELLGVFPDSGYEEPKYLLRRSDGQVMQLPRLLYRVAGSLDGRTAREIATDLSAEFGMDLTAEDVSYLVTDRLRPVGVIAPEAHEIPAADDGGDGSGDTAGSASPAPVKSDPLLALRYRVDVVPAGAAWRIAGMFGPLFARPVWVAALAVFIGLDVLIISQGGLLDQFTAGLLQMVHQPVLILVVFALAMVSGAFHEFGHVTACRYGGGTPGGMGVGLYLVWPAFYSTVTDSYRLSRVGRLRTDLGGPYFDAIFMAGMSGLYLATGEPWLLVALIGMHVETAYQFIPSVRFDGFFILADLVGVPDLFGFVGPVLTSLVPGRPTHPKVRELRPKARRVIVLWVAVTVPLLVLGLSVFLIAAPIVLPVLWQAMQDYLHSVDAAIRTGDVLTTTLHVLQLFFLVLPWLGGVLGIWILLQVLHRLAARRWPRLAVPAATLARVRGVLALAGVGCLAAAVVVRVAVVAGSLPPSPGESRLVASALAGVTGASSAPSVGPAEFLAREQLVGYAGLTGAFSRHSSVVTGGRELAVLATAVLVGCLVTLVFTRRLRPGAVGMVLAAVLVMGPAVSILATIGPGLLGAAWAAAGLLVLGLVAGRTGAVLGGLAITAGVLTAPVIAVLLVVGWLVVSGIRQRPIAGHAGSGPRHARPETAGDRIARWLISAVFLLAAGLIAYLGTRPGYLPGDPTVRTVVLLLGVLLVAAASWNRALRPLAAVAGSAVVLAALPWPAAGVALAVALCAVALLAALLSEASRVRPAAQRSHPLVRAAVAVPVLLVVVVGALFLPAAAPRPPTEAVAAWITGPEAGGGTVAVPAALWGQLIRDGVPPDRLVLEGSASADAAAWWLGTGDRDTGASPTATFGAGGTAVTVHPSPKAVEQQQAEAQQ